MNFEKPQSKIEIVLLIFALVHLDDGHERLPGKVRLIVDNFVALFLKNWFNIVLYRE